MAENPTPAPLLLLSGTANQPLAQEIAEHMGMPLADLTVRRFQDGEIFVRINQNARGRDVFIIQPTPPPAEHIMELLLLIDAAKRAEMRVQWNPPVLGPAALILLLLGVSAIPAIVSYRRRERMAARPAA